MMRLILLLIALLTLTATVGAHEDTEDHEEEATMPNIAYTYQNASGNRLVSGTSTFPDVQTADLQLDGVPLWVVGGEFNGDLAWIVAMDDGRVLAAQPMPGAVDGVSGMSIPIGSVEPGQPIAVDFGAAGLPVILTAGDDLSPFSHPVPVDDDGTLIYVADNGDLVLWRDDKVLTRITNEIHQLDLRPVVSRDGLIAVYAGATDQRYVHAIMGDELEGSSLMIYDIVDDQLSEVARFDLPGNDIFEGISPFWADLDDDGTEEIVTTVANGQVGAWIRAYWLNGSGRIAESRSIGQGFRWRHQIAVGPFGVDGETQLVDVRTPHIGGMPEFFTLLGDELSVNNAQLGYTTHIIRSRNLDMGLAGDFDGDGQPELIATDQARQHVAAVINTDAGVQEAWRLPLDGQLSSNLAAAQTSDGVLALAAGTEDGKLRVWLP
ncbi:MAG: hypothetical protein AAF125_14990 [Chloroflexota bacterium]